MGLGFGFGLGLEPDLLGHRLGLSRRALRQLPAQGEGSGCLQSDSCESVSSDRSISLLISESSSCCLGLG